MKAQILARDLSRLVSAASRATNSRSTLPVLSNVLLQASDENMLRVTGSDLTTSISMLAGANVSKPGAITVPANTLGDLLSTIPGDAQLTLKLGTKDNTLSLSCEKPKLATNIKGIPAMEFPAIPTEAVSSGLELDGKQFKRIVDLVAFAAATDIARPILTGVQIVASGTKATFEAADGFRLAVLELELATPGELKVVIPADALREFARLVDTDGPIGISTINGSQAIMVSGLTTVVAQLIEGAFPDLNAVIPKGAARTKVTTQRHDLNKAFRASDVFARESAHTARLKVIGAEADKPGMLQVIASSSETGDSNSELDATVQGQSIEIAFNVKYVTDLLGAIDAEQVVMSLNLPTTAGIFTPATDTLGTYRYLIMPLHLGK